MSSALRPNPNPEDQVPVLWTQWQGDLVISPGWGFPSRLLLRLLGQQSNYSRPPPHGVVRQIILVIVPLYCSPPPPVHCQRALQEVSPPKLSLKIKSLSSATRCWNILFGRLCTVTPVSWGGVRLSPLAMSVTLWPTVTAPNDRWWWIGWWDWELAGETKVLGENLP
jgi:hypothetical protein